MQNHVDLVANTKRQLEAAGVNLSGPCGAFEITKRVAWTLRGEGCGLLMKTAGNRCEDCATDILMYTPDGELVDILIDGGGSNTPTWQVTGEVRPIDQWRAPWFTPMPPGSEQPPPPDETPQPPAVDDLKKTLALIIIQADQNADAIMARDDANTEKIQQQLNQIVEDAEKTLGELLKELLPILIAGRPPAVPPERYGPTIRRLLKGRG